MKRIGDIVREYNDRAPLEEAWTIPGSWYTNPELFELEKRVVFGYSWQIIGRTDQLKAPGDYITAEVGGEPILAVRAADGALKAFFNVCRHHAAPVATEACGKAQLFR